MSAVPCPLTGTRSARSCACRWVPAPGVRLPPGCCWRVLLLACSGFGLAVPGHHGTSSRCVELHPVTPGLEAAPSSSASLLHTRLKANQPRLGSEVREAWKGNVEREASLPGCKDFRAASV